MLLVDHFVLFYRYKFAVFLIAIPVRGILLPNCKLLQKYQFVMQSVIPKFKAKINQNNFLRKSFVKM